MPFTIRAKLAAVSALCLLGDAERSSCCTGLMVGMKPDATSGAHRSRSRIWREVVKRTASIPAPFRRQVITSELVLVTLRRSRIRVPIILRADNVPARTSPGRATPCRG